MKLLTFEDPSLIQLIKGGAVGILPTDTIYGIHASAFNKDAIEKMYKIRLRDTNKPFILVIHDISQLEPFKVSLSEKQLKIVQDLWGQSVSVIIDVQSKEFEYLTRGTGSIAFRVPRHERLRELLLHTGPLVSTSVNRQGEQPAETIEEASAVFVNEIGFAVDEGRKQGSPSTVVRLLPNSELVEVLRQGSAVISDKYLVK